MTKQPSLAVSAEQHVLKNNFPASVLGRRLEQMFLRFLWDVSAVLHGTWVEASGFYGNQCQMGVAEKRMS